MFERYTEKARRVIFFARHEASEFGSPYIESEHILLGLLRENKVLSARMLSGPSFSIESIRREIERHTTVGKKLPTSIDLPLSDECKRILRLASDEADRLGHKHIGTEHLLVGVLLEKDCYAARLLNEQQISLESVRTSMAEDPLKEFTPTKTPGIPPGYSWKNLLYNPASETIVIEMACTGRGHLPMSRLFARRKDAEVYEQIGQPGDDLSYEAPVTCEKHPIVVFNSIKWEGSGGNPDGVYLFNLITKELTLCLAKDTFNDAERRLSSWISTLVSLSDDGQTLYLKIGMHPFSRSGVVDYYLASVGLADKKLQLLSRLKDVWF